MYQYLIPHHYSHFILRSTLSRRHVADALCTVQYVPRPRMGVASIEARAQGEHRYNDAFVTFRSHEVEHSAHCC